MKIIFGKIIKVIDKGDPSKPWAIIGIQTTGEDRDGLPQTDTVKVRVFGDQIKNGLHNSYRSATGTDVYMPVNIDYDIEYKKINYTLAGLPVPLQLRQSQQPVKQVNA